MLLFYYYYYYDIIHPKYLEILFYLSGFLKERF